MQPATMTLPFSAAAVNCSKRFSLGAVEESAAVDDDRFGILRRLGKLVASRSQTADDPLAIDERLGTAERNKGNLGRRHGECHVWRGGSGGLYLSGIHVSAWHAWRSRARKSVTGEFRSRPFSKETR